LKLNVFMSLSPSLLEYFNIINLSSQCTPCWRESCLYYKRGSEPRGAQVLRKLV
jgi:hypothetical protein